VSLKLIWTGLVRNETFSNGFGQVQVGMILSSEFGHAVVAMRKETYIKMFDK
jgi:hypothetical protein